MTQQIKELITPAKLLQKQVLDEAKNCFPEYKPEFQLNEYIKLMEALIKHAAADYIKAKALDKLAVARALHTVFTIRKN